MIEVLNPLLMVSLRGMIDMLAVKRGERLALIRITHIQSLSLLVSLVVH